jgi:rRNA-processing protein FCF1
MPVSPKHAKQVLRVIMDSNALFVPTQFRIDIFEELGVLLNRNFEPILLTPIRREIQKLAEDGPLNARKDASYALKLAEKCKLTEIDEAGLSPDDSVIEAARKFGCPVFTNDRALKKRLRDINVPVIYVRQKSRLEIVGRL